MIYRITLVLRRLVDRRDSGGSSAGGCGGKGDVVTIAGVFENRAEQVIQAKAEVEKGCLNGWCPVVKSRYSLNRKAKKMTEFQLLQLLVLQLLLAALASGSSLLYLKLFQQYSMMKRLANGWSFPSLALVSSFAMNIKVRGITLPIMKQALLQARDGKKRILAEMLKCLPPPSKILSKYVPLIHVMKVQPEKISRVIGFGGKKMKSIIKEFRVEAIDTQDDGIVKITVKDLSSLKKSKAIISNLTRVSTVGDIFRNCEIKSIAPYGVFVEIALGHEVAEHHEASFLQESMRYF
ncbi:hypothetical protein F0562_025338 [Nyssa sinensis]|uniref:K Homology domain-containing protein n=1 Tax=Nyssa sinensis TaxID=561372 RepID=A0A5J5BHZ2_9ASTE|nr:hypothetical protein F0562_025338 [Nyssa sinensis]